MTIKAGSPEAHQRALKAAATRKRNIREGVTLKGGRAPKQSKPSAKRPVFGSPPPKPARKPATSKPKKFTKLQRQLIAKGIRIERQLQGQNNQARERTLRSEQREIELRLLRLDRDAESELVRRLTEMRAQDYDRSMRDIKKKRAFTSGRFSSGTDYLN